MPFDVKHKLFARSASVNGIDFHPIEPWLLTGHQDGTINIFNLDSGAVLLTFETASVLCVKFIPRMNWLVAGSDDGRLRVFDYKTHELMIAFVAHSRYIRCLTVHPTAPIVLTGSADTTIKAWDWEKQWRSFQTYEGHDLCVKSVAFNPKDSNTFVSSGIDWSVKLWSVDSPVPISTLVPNDRCVGYVEFYPGAAEPYIVTAGFGETIKVWDYFSRSCVPMLEGHTDSVSFAVFHPKLPIIISGSRDCTVKIWNSGTYRVEHTLNNDLGHAWCVALRKDTNEVAVGFSKGFLTFELGEDEPTSFMDHSSSYTYKRNHKDLPTNPEILNATTITSSTNETANPSTLILDQAQHKPLGFSYRLRVNNEGSDRVYKNEIELYQQCAVFTMEAVANKVMNKLVSELNNGGAQSIVEFLSKMVSDEETLTQRERKYALHLLSNLAKSAQVFPQYLELKGVQCNLTNPVAVGGYGFIYKGEHDGNPICVKAVRSDSEGVSRKKMRAHASELIIWAHIMHPNILPFLGIYPSKEEPPRICIVSPWMNNGDPLQYLNKVSDAPRKLIVRDIISGLQCLHEFDIIHADLKARNVLVSETGRAMLTDFGVSRLSMTQTMTLTSVSAGTAYWMAPELLLGEDEPPSRESDIWAFACTCYEIITGTMPFNQHRNPALLISAFMRGKIIPTIPSKSTLDIGWDEDIWSVAEQCWKSDPAIRPKAHELFDMISSFDFRDDRCPEPQSQRRRSPTEINYYRILSILNEIRESSAA